MNQDNQNSKLRIYTLSNYSEELIAVAFAKTSRSPEPFDKIAKELDETKSSKFHERWVVGYGHSSVAEHAILHIAVENASRLAVDYLENSRLVSYTEKSTRYQVITKDLIYVPNFDEENRTLYLETVEYLFNSYNLAIEKFIKYFETVEPKNEQNQKKRKMIIKLRAIDNARFLLPLSTYANVGITINARSLEYMLTKLFSNPLNELKEIATEIKKHGEKEVPTLIKYANESKYLSKINNVIKFEYSDVNSNSNYSVKLVEFDSDAEDKILSSFLYKFSNLDYETAKQKVKNMDGNEREKLFDKVIGDRGKFDRVIREMEYTDYTFDMIMDFGAYYELKRHRMATITPQEIGIDLGSYVPQDFKDAGLEELFYDSIKKSEDSYKKLKDKYPNEAKYICTNANRRRVLVKMNLRELYHFIPLRASPMAHFTIRAVARDMLKELEKVHPLLVKYMLIRDSKRVE